ncbi:MAG: transglycosylase SLT domain-containing protein, partial [Bradyrhizobium sp.]
MAKIEHARADQAWQATRGRAAVGALDWLGENPTAPLMAMPADLRDGLSPEQTEALDRTAANGGRVVTDRDLYEKLDDQAVHEPEKFTGLDLTQYRLSLGDSDYDRLTKVQKARVEGKSDPAFERHSLGRLFLGEGLRAANLDPDGQEARTARQQLDRLLGAFESVEGKPPTMADIRGLVDDVLPRGKDDPNIVRVGGGPLEANGNTQIATPQETAGSDDHVGIAQQEEAQNRQPPPQSAASVREPGRGYGKIPQAQIEKGMTPVQIRINRDQAFRELTRQPLTPKQVADGSPLPDDWETTKPADVVDAIRRAAERHGVPTQMFARLLYQEGKFNEKDKLREPLVMDSDRRFKAIGYAQMNKNTLEDLIRRAKARGADARAVELETYSLGNFRQAFDAAAENLALNYKLTGGSWPQAVAAYNVGAGDLVSWLKGGQKDPIDFSVNK